MSVQKLFSKMSGKDV